MIFSSERECQTDTWDLHIGCDLGPSALHKAKNSKYEQRELLVVVLVGKLRLEQNRQYTFSWGYCMPVLAGAQVTSAT